MSAIVPLLQDIFPVKEDFVEQEGIQIVLNAYKCTIHLSSAWEVKE